jgi:Acetyltransferase (GNAT) domain
LANDLLEICIKGKYFTVPSVAVMGWNLIVSGRLIRVASIHEEEWTEAEVSDPGSCIAQLKGNEQNRLKADIFTFTQKLPSTSPKYSYPLEWDSLAVIELKSFTEWWEGLPQETRKNTRRSRKRGVIVRVEGLDDRLIQKIVDLNNAAPLRQGRPFDHYGKTFQQVKKDQSSFPGRSDYVCAFFGEELVGFIKIVRCGEIATILQIITNDSFGDMRPANALIVRTVEHCLEIGMKYLVYGKYVYGNKRTSTLIEFKKRHGFHEVLVPRYFIPLTIKGRIGMALGLHHDLVGILPNNLIQISLRVRERWYGLKGLGKPV